MELVTFAKEMLQTVAEHAASYRLGQTALRHIDRALWVVEKCARWAVPPPLDQDERPQPELVRPLPWVFFLALLVTLRVTRESISLVNLVMGKPPLRSADVVMYVQSKRRYLRTLKYQGNRMMRARSAEPHASWYSRAQSLLEFAMCARRSQHYGNNNSTRVSNNTEVLVVKRSKRGQSPAGGESTMDRLIEKMMHDLDAGSDDDSSFTLTNVTSIRSDRSDTESDQDTILHHDASTPCDDTHSTLSADTSHASNHSAFFTPEKNQTAKTVVGENNVEEKQETKASAKKQSANEKQNSRESTPKQEKNDVLAQQDVGNKQNTNERTLKQESGEVAEKQRRSETPEKQETNNVLVTKEDAALQSPMINAPRSPKDDTRTLLHTERKGTQQSPSPNNDRKNANGQIMNSASKRKGLNSGRWDFNSNNKST